MQQNTTNRRKTEHIEIIRSNSTVDRGKNYFDAIRLAHRALPEIDLNDVDPSVTFMGVGLSFPLLISSMTGGDHKLLRTINRNLASAAESARVALGVGSQRVMFDYAGARRSFELRSHAPTTLLFSNLGAVQLNCGYTVEHCRRALDILDGNALFLHLNPLQEALQPEGNTNYSGLADKIGSIAAELDRPVIVKEVGAGLSLRDVEMLRERGLTYFDVAGSGGTSWGRIEGMRMDEGDAAAFTDWGLPTPIALRRLEPVRQGITLLASGGLRSGVDMVKALILGASLCGMALPFLEPAMISAEAVLKVINRLKKEFIIAMFSLGVTRSEQLIGAESLIAEWTDL